MSTDADNTPEMQGGAEDGEQPLRILTEQEMETSADFVAKVQRKIHRRSAASQYVSFTWNVPKVVLIELAGVLKHLVGSFERRKDS